MKVKVKRIKRMGKARPNRELRRKGAVRFADLQPIIVESDFLVSVGRRAVKTDTIGQYPKRTVEIEKVLSEGEAALSAIPKDLDKIEKRRAKKDPKYRDIVDKVMDSAKAHIVGE